MLLSKKSIAAYDKERADIAEILLLTERSKHRREIQSAIRQSRSMLSFLAMALAAYISMSDLGLAIIIGIKRQAVTIQQLFPNNGHMEIRKDSHISFVPNETSTTHPVLIQSMPSGWYIYKGKRYNYDDLVLTIVEDYKNNPNLPKPIFYGPDYSNLYKDLKERGITIQGHLTDSGGYIPRENIK